MANRRRGPNCDSMGLAQEPQVGVNSSVTLVSAAHGAWHRADAQRPEPVERERHFGMVLQRVLDRGQLLVLARVGGLLPGAGALKGRMFAAWGREAT